MTKYDKELQTGTEEYEEATEPLEDAPDQHPANRKLRENRNDVDRRENEESSPERNPGR